MATETSNDIRDFHEQLKAILPRLRIYALSLTRDRDAADDLVHDTVIKALTGRHSFQPGTNLAAWLFRIQRNEFISGLRRQRPTVPVDTAIAESLSHPAASGQRPGDARVRVGLRQACADAARGVAAGRPRGPALRGHRRSTPACRWAR